MADTSGLTRRRFLTRVGVAGAGALAGMPLPRWPVQEHDAGALPEVAVLGAPSPDGVLGQLVRGLSDDVFERLRHAVHGRSFRVLTTDRAGTQATANSVILEQANTGFECDPIYLSDTAPVFDLARFRRLTDRWTRGCELCIGSGGDAAELFAAAQVVRMPVLPLGPRWAAHYVDEKTGLVMRALMDYNLETDVYVFRWDVLYG